MKALITGIGGFVGSYLKEYLLHMNIPVIGLDVNKGEDVDYCVNLLDKEAVNSVIKNTKPNLIFHLAAQSSVEKSWKNPELTVEINVIGTKNLFDAIIDAKIKPKVLVISSSHVYKVTSSVPLLETHELNPVSPYAKSKVAQEELCKEYSKKISVIVSRSFNHTGPKQPEQFVIPDFARQIAKIMKNKQDPVINVGNLDVVRDFSDVRDVVRAYYLLIINGKSGEIYNVCSGKGVKLIDILKKMIYLSDKEIEIKVDNNKFRKSEISVLIGDNKKIVCSMGWKPNIKFDKTLEDTIEYWKKNI